MGSLLLLLPCGRSRAESPCNALASCAIYVSAERPGMTNAEKTTENLMLIVDESPATRRAVDYVTRMMGCHRGFHVYLLHLLPPLPAELLEFGGAEDPRQEQQLQAELHRDQQAWIASVKEPAGPTLRYAMDTLRDAGLFTYEIELACSDPRDDRDATVAILNQAREKRCHTLVVGSQSHPWFRQMAGARLTERLLRHAGEITLWVVP
jgi:nucleotide-binding universal stress UspA family protein